MLALSNAAGTNVSAKLCQSLVGVALLIGAGPAWSAAIYSQDVFCGTEKCGTMEIDRYEGYYLWNANNPSDTSKWKGAWLIDGQFTRPAGGYSGFHYVQTVTVDEAPPLFVDGTALPIPYVDPPPGGYSSKQWDTLLYYDENEFPTFYDFPSNLALNAVTQADSTLSLRFETWLVCLVEELLGGDATKASDDAYVIAPLLGWTWGFDIKYTADADPATYDFLTEFSILGSAFAWINTPSADWNNSLTQTYGTGATADRFIVGFDDCRNCVVPAPATMALLLVGFLAMGLSQRRSRRGL